MSNLHGEQSFLALTPMHSAAGLNTGIPSSVAPFVLRSSIGVASVLVLQCCLRLGLVRPVFLQSSQLTRISIGDILKAATRVLFLDHFRVCFGFSYLLILNKLSKEINKIPCLIATFEA